MKTILIVHHGNTPSREKILYAEIWNARSKELMVSATLEYCLEVASKRNYVFVKSKL